MTSARTVSKDRERDSACLTFLGDYNITRHLSLIISLFFLIEILDQQNIIRPAVYIFEFASKRTLECLNRISNHTIMQACFYFYSLKLCSITDLGFSRRKG
jgi:hypothetical protein